jgi:hypothetical protein
MVRARAGELGVGVSYLNCGDWSNKRVNPDSFRVVAYW